MVHEKVPIVDDTLLVAGSTSMDARSFGLNDEVNVAVLDPKLAQQETAQYEKDLSQSRPIPLQEWQRRGPIERAKSLLGWFWVRQQ